MDSSGWTERSGQFLCNLTCQSSGIRMILVRVFHRESKNFFILSYIF